MGLDLLLGVMLYLPYNRMDGLFLSDNTQLVHFASFLCVL